MRVFAGVLILDICDIDSQTITENENRSTLDIQKFLRGESGCEHVRTNADIG